jgi:predicted PurR-regulated permease PerM
VQRKRAVPRLARVGNRERANRIRVVGATRVATSALPLKPFHYAILATLGVGVGLAILTAVSTIATVLVYVGLAGFLALAFEPVIGWLSRTKLSRGLAVGIIALALAGVAVGIMFAVIPAATEQVQALFTSLTALIEDLPHQEWFVWLSSNAAGSIDLNGMLSSVTAFLGDPTNFVSVLGGVFKVGTGIVEGVTGVVVVTVLTIYFMITLPRVKAKTYLLVAASKRSAVVDVAEDISASVGNYVAGQVLLALVNAGFTFLVTSILGSPSPILLAVIAFVGALIPVVGTVFGSLIAVLATLAVSPIAALIAAITLLVYMQVEAYILAPRVMARAVAIPGALVIVAAIAGAALGGVLGALLAVPVAAGGLTLVDRVVIPRQAKN